LVAWPIASPQPVLASDGKVHWSFRDAISNAKFRSRSHRAVIRVYDTAGNVIETHEHKGDFKEW
jgi:hypothetical protein